MVYARTSIPDFSLANAYYALATVTAYEADADGEQTTVLAPLYEQPVGTARLTNPQTLDSSGKFVRPVYIDRDVILIVSGRTIGSHGTGVITVPVFTDALMDTFVGTGAQTAFTLTREASVTTFLDVTIDGARQQPDAAYAVSGYTLTFTEAPPYNAEIFVIHSVTTATASTGPVGPTGPGVPTGGSTGQVLAKVSGTSFDTAWATPATVTSVTMGGDASGSSSAATVTKLQGRAVASTSPSDTYVLAWNNGASQWEPTAPSVTTSVTLAGDVTGGSGANTVVKIQNRTVASTSPSDLQYLGWNNGSSQWEPKTISATTSVTLAGDVSGNSGSNSVDKIKAVAVSATAPTTGQTLTYSGSAWAPATPYAGYDIPVYCPDKPTASMIVARIAAVRAFSLPSGLTGSVANAGTAATASTTFDIHKNTSSVGSCNFAIGATTGTFTFASLTSWASGDVLRVIAPATPDATLADISISFLGSRT